MDRNSVIGFSLLAALLIGYLVYNNHSQKQYQEQKLADSIAFAKAHPLPAIDSSKLVAAQQAVADSVNDSLRKTMPAAYYGNAEMVMLENKKLALQFSTKGAYPVSANLKEYKTYDKDSLILFSGEGNKLSMTLPVDNGSKATSDLYFTPVTKTEANGDQSVDFTADLGNGKKVDIIYSLPADDYMMRCRVQLTGMQSASLPLIWDMAPRHTEKDIENERASMQVQYNLKKDGHDYFTVKDEKKSLPESATWLAMRTHYFNSTLISEAGFSRVDVNANVNIPDSSLVAKTKNTMELALGATQSADFKWYIGPNDYRRLKSYNIGMQEMIPLGVGLMAFVKYVNIWLLIPVFYSLAGFISNYGIIIMLMTIFIRLILSFFTYKSYLSAAKMRVLKPEVDELKAKYADDQQKFGMEQMKLFRSAGVNPLGGCLPTVFQIPILFAMYYLFPNFIEFRQQPFLWANDLSTYDSIVNLPFTIPFYGDHVSLFTLLMTASSLFLALYNRNMTAQDPNNPMMKYMPFIFPVMLMGVFNKMAAALTFYYFFSNCLSILQQFIIQKYIINEKKIHAQIQENKSKPAMGSKWQQRIEQMQKAQSGRINQNKK